MHDRRANAALPVNGETVRVRLALTFLARLRGLLGRPPDDELLLIAPCHAIHTYGMRHPLDVAFVGRNGAITAVYRSVSPAQRVRCPAAVAVIERFARPTPFFIPGDRLALTTADKSETKGVTGEDLSGVQNSRF